MCDLLDRLALDEVLASYPRNRLHDKHPQPPASFESRQPNRPTYRGSILDADPPAQGVNIAGRMTGERHEPPERGFGATTRARQHRAGVSDVSAHACASRLASSESCSRLEPAALGAFRAADAGF